MKMAERDMLAVAAHLLRVLGPEQSLIVGGLAVGGHGYVRATDDVDVIVGYSLQEALRRLRAEGIEATLKRGDPLEDDFPCVRGTLDGIRFDVLPPLVAVDWGKAVEVATDGGPLRVVDLEGLLRLKLRAQGVQDVLDVAVLVLRHPEYRELAREVAASYRTLDRLDTFLADRRTQATAEEQRTREETTTKRRKPAGSRQRPRAR